MNNSKIVFKEINGKKCSVSIEENGERRVMPPTDVSPKRRSDYHLLGQAIAKDLSFSELPGVVRNMDGNREKE